MAGGNSATIAGRIGGAGRASSAMRASRPKRSRAWLLLPALGGGLLIAVGLFLLHETRPAPQSISEVERVMQQLALHRSTRPGIDDGGPIGPWWIAASEVDPITGDFHDFRVRSGSMLIAAARAELIINPELDTFSFELHNVVLTRVPEPGEDEELPHHLIHWEQHTLGPAPYSRDIVDDAALLSAR